MTFPDGTPVSATPTPLEEAVKVLERLAWHRKNLEHHKALAAQRTAEIMERIAYNEANLKTLAFQLKREYGKAETPLPNGGSVRIQKARGSVIVEDEIAAMQYAKPRGLVRVRESVDLAALRKRLVEQDGAFANPETGELLPWIKVERPADGMSLSYTFPKERGPVPDHDMVPVLTAAIEHLKQQEESGEEA